MTRLDRRKSKLTFVTSDAVRERGRLREVVYEFTPRYALVRLSGLRTAFPITHAAIYSAAVKLAVAEKRAAKKAGRKCK